MQIYFAILATIATISLAIIEARLAKLVAKIEAITTPSTAHSPPAIRLLKS